MSLFVCEQCGYIENTATSGYWLRGDNPARCCICDPDMTPHNLFERKRWDGEIVRNPEVIARFVYFKCDPEKCSHLSLGDARLTAFPGAVGVCKDCGAMAQVIQLDNDMVWKVDSI